MGAVYLQNGVCVLPKTDDHVRRLKMLENDISEAQGGSVILETVALDPSLETKARRASRRSATTTAGNLPTNAKTLKPRLPKNYCHHTYAELEESEADLEKLQSRLSKIQKR